MFKNHLGLLLLSGIAFTSLCSQASARDHDHDRDRDRDRDRDHVRLGIGIGDDSHWVDGHYETRTETVIAQPERFTTEVIPAVYETRVDSRGRTYPVQVAPPQTRQVTIPARYETRDVQVWVPGHRESGPRGFLGFKFGF